MRLEVRSSVSQEVKDLRNSVSQEVKDLRNSVSQEVKDLRSSMDQLLAIVKSMRTEKQGEITGLEEVEEQKKYSLGRRRESEL